MITTRQTAQDRAGRLGMEIWLSLLPHAELPEPGRSRGNDSASAAECRPAEVAEATQLSSGDLILAPVTLGRERELDTDQLFALYSTREAVRRRESAVRLVESVSAQSIQVYEHPHIPAGGWASCDPERFGQPQDFARETTRYAVPAQTRRLARIGSLDELLPRLQAHPDYADWVAAYAECERQQEAAQAESRRIYEADQAALAPLKAAAERLTELTAEELVTVRMGYSREPAVEPVNTWLGEDGRLRTYVSGLVRTKGLSVGESLEIEQLLTTLGYPA
ncbi:hypothetical protein ACWDG9_16835 [Streptomyces sp. NPDC001073]